MKRLTPLLQQSSAIVAVTVFLAGCGDGSEQEVRAWMEEVRAQTPISVVKIPAPKTFNPYTYPAPDELDPYSPAKMQVAFAKADANKKSGLQPDLNRRKEPLESFPLDTLVMVGTLQKPGLTYGLLRAGGNVFQVKVGNHIGQNFGLVTRVTDNAVELREIVRDASGEWTERNAKLELQEIEK